MKNRRNGLSLYDHVVLAAELYRFRGVVSSELMNKYPKNSQQVKAMWKLYSAIDKTRSKMDDAFYQEYPQAEYRWPHMPWRHTPYFWDFKFSKGGARPNLLSILEKRSLVYGSKIMENRGH